MDSLKDTTIAFTQVEEDSQYDVEVLPCKEVAEASISDREKSLRHKYDRRILPLGTLIYLIAQVDRSNMSNAVVLGLKEDTDLTGDRFNLVLTLFFITYILFEIPANMMCKHFGPKIWLSFITAGFGLTTIGMAFVSSYPALVALRLLLGAFEAGVQPGVIFTYSQFYRRHEMASRWGIKAAAASVAGAFGGLLGSGLGNIPRVGILQRWRWIFLIEGLITVFVAIAVYWFMPKDIATASFLTDEERQIAVSRIAEENKTNSADKLSWDVFRKALWNLNTQLVGMGLIMSLLSLTSLSLFMPSLLRSMGYSATHAQLLTVPPYTLAAITCICASFLSDRLRNRGRIMLALAPLTMIGFSILATVRSTAIRYFALFLTTAASFTTSPILLAWVVSNSAGPSVRAIVAAYAVGEGNFGAIIATWTYLPKDGPRYVTGHWINFGAACILAVVIAVATMYLRWENKMRAEGKRDYRLSDANGEAVEKLGHSHPEYRYTE